MRALVKKVGIAALAGVSVIGATLASADPAEARWRGHHHHHRGGWGWGGPALIGGLALGAALAAPRYGYGYGYPAYAAVSYGGDCFVRRRVVGYTAYGNPIIRARRVCY